MSIVLRDYQRLGIDMVYDKFSNGFKNVIFWGQTGMGKSICFTKMIQEGLASGCCMVLVVRRKSLIDQASNHMIKNGISHGVHMANHKRYSPKKRVQICSIDTLASRKTYPHVEKKNVILIIDEAHDATPSARKYASLIKEYSHCPIVGFTATPFSNTSLWDAIVKPIEAHELRDQGFLVPETTFVPNIIDTSKVRIKRNGEFDERELFEASSNKKIIGDFVRDWIQKANNRKTILFAVNVEHSKMIAEVFNKAGIPAVHADGTTKLSDRNRAIRKLLNGDIKVITNVNIFSTGLDVPEIGCVQICRPTQSLIWHLQAIGRGLRTASGKTNCIIIDNAGNTLRHGGAYKVREVELGKQKKRIIKDIDEDGDISIRRCKRCSAVFEAKIQECPECGFVNPKVKRRIDHEDGELVQYEISEEEKQALIKSSFVSDYYKLSFVANKRKFHKKWTYNKLEEKYGLTVCKQYGEIVGLKY